MQITKLMPVIAGLIITVIGCATPLTEKQSDLRARDEGEGATATLLDEAEVRLSAVESILAGTVKITAGGNGATIKKLWIKARFDDGTIQNSNFFGGSSDALIAVAKKKSCTLQCYFPLRRPDGRAEIWARFFAGKDRKIGEFEF